MSWLKTFQYSIAPLFLLLCSALTSIAQTTAFTYQGRLQDAGSPANGTYDFQFRLFDAPISGNQIATTIVRDDVPVSNGTFTVTLDFGAAALSGADRYLELGVRPGANTGAFTTLSPLQQLTSTPYAVRSLTAANALNATSATNASQLGGIAASSYVQTSDPRLTDARPPAPGSSSYVQNSTLAQPNSNFNVSGDGTAAGTLSATKVNALTEYDVNGNRVLSVSGADNDNTFTGVGAGAATNPQNNAFGHFNSFFGRQAGGSNNDGYSNSYFGDRAGFSGTTECCNSFFGAFAGELNAGGFNSFFGSSAGDKNSSGLGNSFFGSGAGIANTTGLDNTFVGLFAGFDNNSGQNNSFFGQLAGRSNLIGSRNTIIGDSADVSFSNLTNATAIGANAFVSQSNSLVLGSINQVGSGTADTNVGIGTSVPAYRLHVLQRTANTYAANIQTFSIAGGSFGLAVTAGTNKNDASFTARNAGGSDLFSVRGDGTVGIGTSSPTARLQTEGSGLDSIYAHSVSGIGLHARSEQTWAGYFEGFVFFSRGITLTELAGGSGTPLCRNSSNEISSCSSSLRYKRDIHSFVGGLDIVNRLRPISFTWKQDGNKDIGFGAEEVEKVAPLFTFRNNKGEIEGVRYDRLSVVFVNAFKEQQAQIEKQQEQLRRQEERSRQEQEASVAQQQQLNALKALLCRSHRSAKVCR